MTNQEKEQFFALYWKQDVGMRSFWEETRYVDRNFLQGIYTDESYLLLKYLKNISDEDAIEVAKIVFPRIADWQKPYKNNDVIWVDDNESMDYYIAFTDDYFEAGGETFDLSHELLRLTKASDYLRSKGYALPWKNYSIENLINEGVIKLI